MGNSKKKKKTGQESKRTRQTNKRGDRKEESNNSPGIPGRSWHQSQMYPRLPFAINKIKN